MSTARPGAYRRVAAGPPAIALTSCPACGSPAEIQSRFVLESTGGPIEHVKVACVQRHWFVMPSDALCWARRVAPTTTDG
ncbi:MAG: hypothetical protein GEU81_08840 [Nitriliruptorales bacterium]|nr:hypothetical protein [Nitriliruptorales bacterium]